ncbi:MAG: MobA/MobL family protein, partial [Gammaproteobacteria bacterium]|nr:MobA/MobL family protein [Gammaproteobacteria bacterium]
MNALPGCKQTDNDNAVLSMAIAFASVTIHSRSQGYSAVAASAYRSGTVLRDERTGETHHYGHRTDVAYSQIMLPEGADDKFLDREYLWNEVERAEKRQDAQLAKDVILALPKELNLDQQITLARQFANYHFVSKGLVADVAIHNDEGNPHAHIYITTRRLIGDKFDRYKARDLNPLFANRRGNHGFIAEKDYWGEQWRTFQTDFFTEHNLEITVDANYLVPTRHEGRIRESEHYLKEENQLLREANVELALESPESLLNLLSLHYSVFREADIQKLVFKQTQGGDAYNTAIATLKAHPDLIELANGIYTTKANYQQEASLADTAEHLVQQRDRVVSGLAIQAIGDEQQLSTEQRHALKHIATSGKLSAIVGRAGTGKSHLMRAVQIL